MAEKDNDFGPSTSSNIPENELDEETTKKLRGDAIGDTMYSESFVLKTLLQLPTSEWSSEFENDLCLVWDMTLEKDVCQYLYQASYPSLACFAIENYEEPRAVELVVGIFANLLSSECKHNVKEKEYKAVLNLLNSDDPPLLIQVVRFAYALTRNFLRVTFIEEVHLSRLNYILCNSMNKELLSWTMKALACLMDQGNVSEGILKGELLGSVVTAYRVLKQDCERECEFETQEQQEHVNYLLTIVCSLCNGINEATDDHILNELRHVDDFINEVKIILNFYKNEDNLLPVTSEFQFCIDSLEFIFKVLRVKYMSSIARDLYNMFYIIYKKDLSSINVIGGVFCYFLSVGTLEELKKDFRGVCATDVRDILLYIEKNKFECEFSYMDNVKRLLVDL